MEYTLGQAAKEAKVGKSTLSRALNEGRLSGDKQEDGSWQIDASELGRWLEGHHAKGTPKIGDATPIQKEGNGATLQAEIDVLRKALDTQEAERERERRQLQDRIDDLVTQREEQAATFRQSLAVLTDKREKATQRRWWGLLRLSAK